MISTCETRPKTRSDLPYPHFLTASSPFPLPSQPMSVFLPATYITVHKIMKIKRTTDELSYVPFPKLILFTITVAVDFLLMIIDFKDKAG